jgi:hypothetical protein
MAVAAVGLKLRRTASGHAAGNSISKAAQGHPWLAWRPPSLAVDTFEMELPTA